MNQGPVDKHRDCGPSGIRVLLVHPTFLYPDDDMQALRASMAPLAGVNILAQALRASGHEALVVDPFYYYIARLGAHESFEGMVGRVAEQFRPALVCVSVVSHLRASAEAVVRRVKRLVPETLVAVGGVHVTDGPELAARQFSACADLVIAGAGEIPLTLIASALRDNEPLVRLPGLVWADARRTRVWLADPTPMQPAQTPPPESLPFPDYRQYTSRLKGHVLRRAIFSTTRGCPFSCRFCSAASTASRKWQMTPELVIEHLRHLRERYGILEISFHDETFFHDTARAARIFDLMKAGDVRFDDVYLHTTLASLERDVLRSYRGAGGRRLFAGLESGSARIRHEMRKPFAHRLSNEEILKKSRLCREEGIDLGLFMIVGWPGETAADRGETLRLLEAMRPADVQTSVLKIYPGTDIYARALQERRLRPEDWLDRDRAYFTYAQGDDLAEARAFAHLLETHFQTHSIRKLFESQGDRYADLLVTNGGLLWPPELTGATRTPGLGLESGHVERTSGEALTLTVA